MKKVTRRLSLLAIAVLALASLIIQCKKSSNNGPSPIGGYTSSDAVASSNLIAYWPMDGDANDHKRSLTATTHGSITYSTGMRGQAYQGTAGAYATLSIPNSDTALWANIGSYTLSFWYNLPAQPVTYPQGIFFLSGTTTLNELIYEIEHYAPVSGDSVSLHNGFTNLAHPLAPYQGFTMQAYPTASINNWVHIVATYNGGSSTYIIYKNAVPIQNQSTMGFITPNILYQESTSTNLQGNIDWSNDEPKSISIGSWPDGLYGQSAANDCFLGKLDEIRVYNKALTQTEVSGLFLNGQAGR